MTGDGPNEAQGTDFTCSTPGLDQLHTQSGKAAELTDPVVPVDLMQMVRRGRELPCAAEFGAFLASRIAGWIEPWSPGFERAA